MNAHHVNKSCLYSTVKNVSGVEMPFGFLPPHGVRLAADEEYTIFGSILEAMTTRRDQISFGNAIDEGLITIISTPTPIILDTNGSSKMLKSTAGTLSTVAPCFDTSDSLDAVVPV